VKSRSTQFLELMLLGDVNGALKVAPWGWASRWAAEGGYVFRFTDGPYETATPVHGATITSAVVGCIREALRDAGTSGEVPARVASPTETDL
jgi:hypothetical protein